MILHSLLALFTQFKMEFKMNKIVFSLSELMSSLQATEVILKVESKVKNIEKASSSETNPLGISVISHLKNLRIIIYDVFICIFNNIIDGLSEL